MKFTFQVIFLFVSLILCQAQTQFETGNQVIVTQYPANVLTNQQNVPREIGIKVQFKKPFNVVPQVFISSQVLDYGIGSVSGFIIKASQITTTGFLLSGIAVSPLPIYALSADWFAFDDSRIKVVEYERLDVPTLSQTGSKYAVYTIYHQMTEKPTQGIVSLTGIKHSLGNPVVEVKLEEITDTTIKVSARKYGDCQVIDLRFNVLLGTSAALWASTPQQFTFAKTHPFVSRSPGVSQVKASADVPAQLSQGTPIPIAAIRGYDVDKTRNMRLRYVNAVLGSQLQYSIETWWDTSLNAVFHQGAAYIPKIPPPSPPPVFDGLWSETPDELTWTILIGQ